MKRFCLTNEELGGEFSKSPKNLIERAQELNNITDNIQKSESIALVGNSSTLLDHSYGKLIDSHDYVIRFNIAIIDGYEKYVGSKTSYRWICSKMFLGLGMGNYSSYDVNFLPNLKEKHFLIYKWPHPQFTQGMKKNYHSKTNIHFLNKKSHELVNNTKVLHTNTVSSGGAAVVLASHLSDNVSLFGFNFLKDTRSSFHYFEDTRKASRTAHDFTSEKRYIDSLVKQEKVNYYKCA